MRFLLANLFGVVSGTLIMFFAHLVCEVVLTDGLATKGLLLVPFTLGWLLAIAITKPRRSTPAEVIDRGLLLGATEWGLAFPAVFVAALAQELDTVTSASVVGYALGGLLIGGGVTLLGLGFFLGVRYVALRVLQRPAGPVSSVESG